MGSGASKANVQPSSTDNQQQQQQPAPANSSRVESKRIEVQPALETIAEGSENDADPGIKDFDNQRKQLDSDLPRSLYTEHRSRNNLTSPGDERVELLKLLEQEARKITSQPPGPVENSQTYAAGREYYKNRCIAQTEEQLRQWFKQEKSALQQETVDYMIKAKFDDPTKYKITRQNHISEFKLKLSSLVNQYLDKIVIFDAEKLRAEQEKNEDILFFGTMLERIKNGAVRPDVLTSMDGYSTDCRRKMASSSGRSAASWNSYGSSSYPRPLNGYPPQQQLPTPISRAQLHEEATDVLAHGRQSAQKTADVRRMEREALREVLNSRVSSVLPVTDL